MNVRLVNKQIYAVALALILALAASGCSTQADPISSAQPQVATTTPTATPSLTPVVVPPARVDLLPIKIAVLMDKTESSKWTRTQQLQPEDVTMIIDLLRRSGGEIGVGLVSDDSNRSLLRLRIEVPPIEPTLEVHDPEVGELDAYDAAQKQKDNDAKRVEFDKEHDRYLNAKKAWDDHTNQQIERFTRELKTLLAVKPHFHATDVWGAISRAELFLGEDDSSWPQSKTRRYLALISDAQHNVRKSTTVSMNSGAKLILVNGSRSVGVLGPLKPEMFESAQAAFLHVAKFEGGKE